MQIHQFESELLVYARAGVLRAFGALFIVLDAKHFSSAAGVASNPPAEKTAPKAVFLCLQFGPYDTKRLDRAAVAPLAR